MSARCRIVVMAKAPLAGHAKTRLAPALGAAGAARLAARMLAHAVEQAAAAGLGPVEICCTPDASHPAFAALARCHAAVLSTQGEGDLGERMSCALERGLREGPTLVIGTDAPRLDADCLRRACDALADHDAVFVPALDGGYALVGLRAHAPELFRGIEWSTPRVMADTRLRLARLGLRHHELPALADVDEPADLSHVPAHWLDDPA